MPINPTTLKALIDTQITNETVDFAITPTEVGSRMKDTIDYTTEQIALAEVLTNKSTNVTTDGASDTKYPSVKAVKTYVDANASVSEYKVLKTSITSAQILDIFTTPIDIIPAPGAGKMIIPSFITLIIRFNSSTYTDTGGAWKVVLGTSGLTITTIVSYLGSSTFDKETIQSLFYSAATTFGTFINQPLRLTTTGNNPLGGNSGIDVYVTYAEVTI